MKKNLKKILLWSVSTFLLLFVILCVHIYLVYKPKASDKNTRVMARIDIKQTINQNEANKIASWMLHQNGVDHVLVNPQSSIVIFTFFPIKTNGNTITQNFKSTFNLNAVRFMPSEQDLKKSCPMSASSFSLKIYQIISHLI